MIFSKEDGGYMKGANIAARHFHRCLQAAELKRR
jgi:hypothetical protein